MTRSDMRALAIASLVLLALFPGRATHAQSPPGDRDGVSAPQPAKPTAAQRRAAKRAYARGAAHQEKGEYEQAVTAYKEAYELTHSAALLFNIAQAYRLGGNKPAAIDYYRRYLKADPEGRGAPEAYGHVTALEGELAAQRETERRQRAEAEAETERQRAERIEDQRREEAKRRQLRAQELTLRRDAQGRDARRWQRIGLLSAAGGAALGVVGAIFHAQAAGKSNDVENAQGAWSRELDATVADGEAAERNAIVFYSLAGAAVAAGAAFYLLGQYKLPIPSDDIAVRPVIAPNAVGAAIRVPF